MKKKSCCLVLTAMLVLNLVVVGCATTGESAGLGAGLGALAGGIIGHQSGRAVEGALIGGLVGGLAGAIIGHERQKQLASRQQVEQEYFEATGNEVVAPTVYWEKFNVTPQSVRPGQNVAANGRYVLMGPPAQRSGTITFKRKNSDDEPITAEMKEVKEGRLEFERDLKISDDIADGEYELAVEVRNGNSTARESQSFVVARQ